ncbi:HpcH/HpaI aldolase/citrate lyase family protein [Desulfosporosinus sp. PR]|uniref:HpcH/HpaI aldolase/citrate lyase family protein n=1 Tax=Candidatus Desulfosporosinus nitrosoreducens TaxID=3401928 RepID=UPI0027F7DDA8|nr:HpcH/HpaI aldolase/citrate lyase family protein [Desulfosporosinus sp. PR]MDQ7096881.1 HpcH/HpaI aldolase/citrate lyase family protein [Desulfosporosinus sp. PR]
MKHFSYLTPENQKITFFKGPEPFNKHTPRSLLSHALGATLYMPGTRETIAQEFIRKKNPGLVAAVVCLEDSIADSEVILAEENLTAQIRRLGQAIAEEELASEDLPLIFIRVRTPDQVLKLVDKIGKYSGLLTGFVFPKFSSDSYRYLEVLGDLNSQASDRFYGMPIIESPKVIYRETRLQELLEIKGLLDAYQDLILNVRIGATDFSGLFGIRRGPDVTIYDITVIRDCIADILNIFGRIESDYVLSGPVWEYFAGEGRVLKPLLRRSPFEEFQTSPGHNRTNVRQQLLNKYMDGLIREVILDKENGLIGKTVIHPSHLIPVHALYVVGYEEYLDALAILEQGYGQQGVLKSHYANKMNEPKPHYHWAQKILLRARNYGVYNEQQNFVSLFTQELHV